MSLIAGNNAVYNFLQHRTILHLYLITFACTTLLLSAGFFFVYLPLHHSLEYSHNKVAQMRTQLKTMNSSKHSAKKLQESVTEMQSSIKGYVQNRAMNLIMNDAVVFITECAAGQKLTIGSCRLCTQRDKQWCKLNQITGQFTGTMDQLIAFFQKIQRSNKLIKCKKFELTKQADANFSLTAVFQVLVVT
jgi:Tfp pilus assembly protein PilO